MVWLPATADSAVFRAKHPKSWWWNPTHDFMALMLQAVQGANWQRSGGKGSAPERIKRPDDRPPRVTSVEDLDNRRAAQREELSRRRKMRESKGA